MSWSLSATSTSTDDVAVAAAIDASLAVFHKLYEHSDYELSAESEAQVSVAKDAALAIVKSGKVGTGVGVVISMSGHANPEHKATPGYPNDTVTVSVSQAMAAQATS